MVFTFDHKLIASFFLWIDHEICQNGQAYVNYSSELFKLNNQQYGNQNLYASPLKQWIYDSSISGSIIPSGVYVNGNYTPRGTSGLKIDFNNGSAYFPSGLKSNDKVSGQYAYKEFSMYYTNTEEETLLFNTVFVPRPKTLAAPTGLNPNEKVIPAMFIKYTPGRNDPFAFGGLDATETEVRVIVIADNDYLLDGACGILRDTARKTFALLENNDLPINEFGDLKSGIFNYVTTNCQRFQETDRRIFIKNVYVSKFNEKVNSSINISCFGAFIDFQLQAIRYPRQ